MIERLSTEQLEEGKALARMLRQRVRFLAEKMPPRERFDVPSLEAAADALDQSLAEIERLREALEDITCFDDTAANAYLKNHGSHTMFDEPGSVKIARDALKEPT